MEVRPIELIESDIASIKNVIAALKLMGSESVYSEEDMCELFRELDEAKEALKDGKGD